ncbi:MAG: glycosyltransferase family 4 protein [Clostridium sp.]
MKKRIMYIAQSPCGVEKYLQMFFKYIDKKKYESILIAPLEYSKEVYVQMVDNFEQVNMVRNIKFKEDLNAIVKIRKLIKKYNPDIIYLHSSKAGALGRIANIGLKKKVIYNPHGWSFNMKVSKLKKRIYIIIEKILAPFCDKIIAISEAEKESALSKKICSKDKICVIFNGIDVEEYDKKKQFYVHNKENLNIPKEKFIIGMVGRITKQKASDTFIKVAYEVKKKINNAYFIIVGDGEDRKELIKLINKLKLTNDVLITGWIEDPYKYIETFDIAMLLSRWEGFGLAIAEYMIAEKPIIATNVDAIPNLIDNQENGILVDIDAIDETVDNIINLYEDKVLKDKLVKNAKYRVRKQFDVKRVIQEHEKLIEEII